MKAKHPYRRRKMHVVVIYNPRGWKRYDVRRLPVVNANIAVYDSSGKQVDSHLLPIVKESISDRDYYATAYMGKSPSSTPKYWLAFTASIPSLGFSTYTIFSTKTPSSNFVQEVFYKPAETGKDVREIGARYLKLTYSGSERKAFSIC
ncbi:hypothetical protein R6Q57_027094 [Mikania cordata]